jgi:hypothetical protein
MTRRLAEDSRAARSIGTAARWLLGAAIAGQAAHLLLVVGVIAVATVEGRGNPGDHLAIGIVELVVHFATATILVSFALFALVRHAQENPRLDDPSRRRWLVSLALWGPVTMPVYWWRYLRAPA